MKVIVSILIAFSCLGFGQSKPNLSGEWQIDKSDSRFVFGSGQMGSMLSKETYDCFANFTIEHAEPEIVIKRKGKCPDGQYKATETETTHRYFTDGRGEENSDGFRNAVKSETRWEKNRLIITEYQIDRNGRRTPTIYIKITISKKGDKLEMNRILAGKGRSPVAFLDHRLMLIYRPRK